MPFATVTLFFTLLGLLAAAVALMLLGAAGAALAGRDRAWRMLASAFAPIALPGAWVVALTTALGSLYYSEIVGFVPCTLCWYQRIALYPLVVILGVAALRDDSGVRRYALPLVVIGALIAGGHTALEWAPITDTGLCTGEAPCGVPAFRSFGFVSLPLMALSGFGLIGALLLTTTAKDR